MGQHQGNIGAKLGQPWGKHGAALGQHWGHIGATLWPHWGHCGQHKELLDLRPTLANQVCTRRIPKNAPDKNEIINALEIWAVTLSQQWGNIGATLGLQWGNIDAPSGFLNSDFI